MIMTDGHTRAFFLYKLGKKCIYVNWGTEEMDWGMYQLCVNWCLEENFTSIGNLEGIILKHSDYKIQWIRKCQIAENQLVDK